MTIAEKDGLVPEVVIPGSEEEMGKEALREAFKLAICPTHTAQVRTANIRTVLEWTKAKPAQKIEAQMSESQQWLASLAEAAKAKRDAAK